MFEGNVVASMKRMGATTNFNKLTFSKPDDEILLFIVKDYTIKTDINVIYIIPKSVFWLLHIMFLVVEI